MQVYSSSQRTQSPPPYPARPMIDYKHGAWGMGVLFMKRLGFGVSCFNTFLGPAT